MNDHEKAAAEVRALELKHSIDEMRCVHLEDGRNTIHEIYMRNEFGEWGTLGVGLARRRKGDKRDQRLGGSLSLYRALVNMAERHREEFAKRWPEYFPKDTVNTDAHAEAETWKRHAAVVQEQIDGYRKNAMHHAERANHEAGVAFRAGAELERWKELAAKRKERMHRYLDAQDDEWIKQRDRIDALTAERDQARRIAVALEQQNARALELLESSPEGWLNNSANINAAIAVLRGDDAED